MLQIILSIIGILLTIGIVVGTHEYAHFLMARLCGVKVLRFSIGFGKAIFKWRDKKETEYVFAWIPLGGYVQMLGEGDDEGLSEKDKKRAYHNQPYYKKFLIVAAGPLMNFLCAVLIYWLIYSVGFNTVKPVIGKVEPNSIAAKAGMRADHQIINIDGQPTPTWISIVFKLLLHTGDNDRLIITTTKGDNPALNRYVLKLHNWKMDDLTPEPLESLGLRPYEPPMPLTIGLLQPGSPADKAGLALKDKLLRLNGKKIKSWEQLVEYTASHPGKKASLTIKRGNKRLTKSIVIGTKSSWFRPDSGFIGIGPFVEMPKTMIQRIQYNPIMALPYAANEAWLITHFNLVLFGKMLTGKLSLNSLGGPITIFQSAGTALNSGWIAFLSFVAFLSVSIGVINLFPIPGLDGFHLLTQTIEAIIRRPIPNSVLFMAYRVGIALLFVILVRALANDILRMV